MSKTYFRASDASDWALCHRRAWYNHHLPDGFEVKVERFDQLIQQEGLKHEAAVLASLPSYVEAVDEGHTRALMAAMTPIIYQGVLIDDEVGVVCKPDFLRLEEGRYRAEDAKLSSKITGKKGAIAQLGTYDLVLDSGLSARAIMPHGKKETLTEKDRRIAATFIDDMSVLANSDQRPSANYVASKCGACPYSQYCVPEFKAENNLGLNYFVDNRALPGLKEIGITTLEHLAVTTPEAMEEIPFLKKLDRRQKAILQAKSLLKNRIYRLAKTASVNGTSIHFDVETWPFGAEGKGTVYLWGFAKPPYGPSDFEYIWADDIGNGDMSGWLDFLALIERYRKTYEKPVLVHYTDFEKHQIRHYADRYSMQDNPQVKWLLEDPDSCFDIKEAISDSLILPVHGYGLKTICKPKDLVNFQWALEESGSQWSVVRYSDYLNCDDKEVREKIKQEILLYNKDDVFGTRAQEVWLASLTNPALFT